MKRIRPLGLFQSRLQPSRRRVECIQAAPGGLNAERIIGSAGHWRCDGPEHEDAPAPPRLLAASLAALVGISAVADGLFVDLPPLSTGPNTAAAPPHENDNSSPRQSGDEGLSARLPEDVADARLRKPSRTVGIDFEQLDAVREAVEAQHPAQLTLNLFDGVRFSAVVERTTPTSSGYSLSGRLEGVPFGKATLVVNGGVVMGTVRTLRKIYAIRPNGPGAFLIEEVEARPLREGELPTLPQERRMPDAAEGGDDGSEIDVLILWTPAVRREFATIRQVQAMADLLVAETNGAYSDSEAEHRIKLVAAAEVNYEESETADINRDALHALADPSDGELDEVHALRDSYSADLVHLLVAGGGGIAYVGGDFGVTGVERGYSSATVFAHELGHNMELHHDRYQALTEEKDIGNLEPPYRYGYVNQRAFEAGAPESTRWQTIMAYHTQCADADLYCEWLLRFSNPRQRHPHLTGGPLGVPGDEPSATVDGPADAVRLMNENRKRVANWRSSASRCEYRLSPQRQDVPRQGGSFAIDVDTMDACAYAVRLHDGFLSLASDSAGSGSGEVRYRVAANDGAAREGGISIAGEMFSVRQSAGQAIADVCERSPPVRDAIVALSGRERCADMGESDLMKIERLELRSRGMTALKAHDFANLGNLRLLDLGDNQLAGPIPPELGDLGSLEWLWLSGNQLDGPVPPELGDLGSLEGLFLSGNQLDGCMPDALRDVANSDLDRLGLPYCTPRTVVDLAVESRPRDGVAYAVGERIAVAVRFSMVTKVSGSPRLALRIGSRTRWATFAEDRRGGQVVFHYDVQAADRDADGIGIAADALTLNGGAIEDPDGNDAIVGLGDHAFVNDPVHKVQGDFPNPKPVPNQALEAGGEALALDLSRIFAASVGHTLSYAAQSDGPGLAVRIEDGVLTLVPGEDLDDGVVTVAVTATDDAGFSASVRFSVAVEAMPRSFLRGWRWPVLTGEFEQEQEAAVSGTP